VSGVMAVSQQIQSSACLANSTLKFERKSDITSIENSHLVVCGPQLIWKGNIQELRHFTLDVLKLTGKWKSPGGDVKMFTASRRQMKDSSLNGKDPKRKRSK
jgi:hypothetical protein